jgi:hypothetical protein
MQFSDRRGFRKIFFSFLFILLLDVCKKTRSENKQELLGQFSSTVEQDCTTKKDDFRNLRKKFKIKI